MEKKVLVGINVTPKERDKVHELAQKRGFKITSDYLRFLIEEDAKAHEAEIVFDVDRGGDRRPETDAENE